MHTVTTCTEGLRTVSPTPTCAPCCSNCDEKVKTCAAIVDCCPIRSIKHFVFWHRFNYSNCQPTCERNKVHLGYDLMIGDFRFSTFYTKLKATLQKPLQPTNGPQKCHENGIEVNGKFFEQNLQQIAHANTTINRFLSAFIDHVCFLLTEWDQHNPCGPVRSTHSNRLQYIFI